MSYCQKTQTVYFYDDKNKEVLYMHLDTDLSKTPIRTSLLLKYLGQLRGPVSFGRALRISVDGRYVYGNEYSKKIKIFDVDNPEEIEYIEFAKFDRISGFEALRFNRIITLTLEGTLKLYNDERMELDSLDIFDIDEDLLEEGGHATEFTRCLAVSHDSTQLAIASYTKGNCSSRIFVIRISHKSELKIQHIYQMKSSQPKSEIKAMGFVPDLDLGGVDVQPFDLDLAQIQRSEIRVDGDLKGGTVGKRHQILIAQSQDSVFRLGGDELVKTERNRLIDFTARFLTTESGVWSVDKLGGVGWIGYCE